MEIQPVRDNFLIFGAPALEDVEIEEIIASMKTGWLGTGPKVARFEKDFAKYKDVEYAVAVNSCTAALHLSCLAAGIEQGDEVITTPMTFCSTINAIIHAGGIPVLVDVDPLTMNINPDLIEAKITSKTKAILPVHFAGRACEMDVICDIARRYNLKVIEDCAHAIETEYQSKKAGTFGDFGCFSFYVTKNLTTGEGGMVLTKRAQDAARIKTLALHGMSHDAWKRFSDEGYKHYQVVECGFKYNMMDLQAAIGIHQLARVEQNWQKREMIWNLYNTAFKDLPIITPLNNTNINDMRHAHHLYTILIDEGNAKVSRDTFLDLMIKQNIGVGVHYMSIPEHPYYQRVYGWIPEEYPEAMKIGRQTVSLPLSAKLTDEDILDVIEAVRKAIP